MNRRSLRLNIPLPHSVNSLYFVEPCKQCGNPHVRQRKSYRARRFSTTWIDGVALEARDQEFHIKPKIPYRISGWVILRNKRSDMQNRLKHGIDCICEGLGLDDRYLAEVQFRVAYDPINPRMEVVVEEIEWPEIETNLPVLEERT